jgi:hypothetical protein
MLRRFRPAYATVPRVMVEAATEEVTTLAPRWRSSERRRSNYVWAVRMVCAEKGVAYDSSRTAAHAEVDAIHPFGKIR